MAHGEVEEQIAKLRALAADGTTPATIAALRKALADRVGLVVGKAANLVGQLQIRELLPDLLRAFDRLMENPIERDPQCWGKNGIAKALTELDYRESASFLRGARHVQMEPVWGGQEDTASTLRGICVLGLASCTDIRRDEILRLLVDRLAESAYTVRVEAARAIAQMGGDEASLLLRLKARMGDEEPRVVGQVFDCLLALEGEHAVKFVAEFMESDTEEVAAEATLSLGTSRLGAAIDVLKGIWEANYDPDLRLVILRGLSASRQEAALQFLIDLVRKGRGQDAASALEALSIHRESDVIKQQVEVAARQAGPDVMSSYRKAFRHA